MPVVALLLGVVLLSAVARFLAARGELWLDEIWSFRLAHLLQSPLGVLTGLHHDNNHHLNTLYLYYLPETTHWMVYRLPALVAGVGTVAMAAAIARRRSATAALAAAALTGGSYLLTLYSSEARGYSLAVFAAFLAIPLAERFFATKRAGWALAFGGCAALGILSHVTFLHAYLGLAVWTGVKAWRGRSGGWTAPMVGLHALPVTVLAALYWVDLRYVIEGGGPLTSPIAVASRVLSLLAGGPVDGVWVAPIAAAVAIAGVVSLNAVRRSGSDLWILLTATTVVAPAATLLLVDTSLLFERYFLVAGAFLVFSFSWVVANLADRSRWLAAALVAICLAGNVSETYRLVVLGRGHYQEILTFIAEHSNRPVPTVGTDHDFRQGRVVEFYLRHTPGGDRVRHQLQAEWGDTGPEWFLVHSQSSSFAPKAQAVVDGRWPCELVGTYPAAAPSGWTVALYHNQRDGPVRSLARPER